MCMFSRCALWIHAMGGKNKKCRNRIFFQAICSPCKTHRNDLLGKHIYLRHTIHMLYGCVIVERAPYTPVITDITFNPFCIVRSFPLFSRTISIIRSKWFVPHHRHCSMFTTFGAMQYGNITWTQCFHRAHQLILKTILLVFIARSFTFVN